ARAAGAGMVTILRRNELRVPGQAERARTRQVRDRVDRPVTCRRGTEVTHQDAGMRQTGRQIAAGYAYLLDRLGGGRPERAGTGLARTEEPIPRRHEVRPRPERAQVHGDGADEGPAVRRAVQRGQRAVRGRARAAGVVPVVAGAADALRTDRRL